MQGIAPVFKHHTVQYMGNSIILEDLRIWGEMWYHNIALADRLRHCKFCDWEMVNWRGFPLFLILILLTRVFGVYQGSIFGNFLPLPFIFKTLRSATDEGD